MKKLFGVVFGVCMFIPFIAGAQSVSQDTLKQSLIALLTQMIQTLEGEIQQILAQQQQQTALEQQLVTNTQQIDPQVISPISNIQPIVAKLIPTQLQVTSMFGNGESSTVLGGGCNSEYLHPIVLDQNGMQMINYPVIFTNPETEATTTVYTAQDGYRYLPLATSTTEVINYTAGTLSNSFTLNVDVSLPEKDKLTPWRIQYTSGDYATDLTSGGKISTSTGLCL